MCERVTSVRVPLRAPCGVAHGESYLCTASCLPDVLLRGCKNIGGLCSTAPDFALCRASVMTERVPSMFVLRSHTKTQVVTQKRAEPQAEMIETSSTDANSTARESPIVGQPHLVAIHCMYSSHEPTSTEASARRWRASSGADAFGKLSSDAPHLGLHYADLLGVLTRIHSRTAWRQTAGSSTRRILFLDMVYALYPSTPDARLRLVTERHRTK